MNWVALLLSSVPVLLLVNAAALGRRVFQFRENKFLAGGFLFGLSAVVMLPIYLVASRLLAKPEDLKEFAAFFAGGFAILGAGIAFLAAMQKVWQEEDFRSDERRSRADQIGLEGRARFRPMLAVLAAAEQTINSLPAVATVDVLAETGFPAMVLLAKSGEACLRRTYPWLNEVDADRRRLLFNLLWCYEFGVNSILIERANFDDARRAGIPAELIADEVLEMVGRIFGVVLDLEDETVRAEMLALIEAARQRAARETPARGLIAASGAPSRDSPDHVVHVLDALGRLDDLDRAIEGEGGGKLLTMKSVESLTLDPDRQTFVLWPKTLTH